MSHGPRGRPLEIWGGLECTVNRVGERWFDQIARSGHDARLDDLDRFAALGLRTLRYPVLWERVAPNGAERANWAWPDERLARLRSFGIRPIVGLVHHGSGPRGTDLLDPGFTAGLARYAGAVAARYPWVEDYTPVNEPLTTARFAALYGHWYPHRRDALSFVRALLNECRATAEAMRAIRVTNPAARLVQTEDLGEVGSSPSLTYQAEFENERRWLTFDLLCGRVDGSHPLWDYLRWLGIAEAEMSPFLDAPCPPSIVGINYYPTSERFLDDRLDRYPPHTHGGNGRHRYADVEAVRARAEGLVGPAGLLRQAWQRYRLPLAITEAHLGCTREEQLRWLTEVWEAAEAARSEGADVRAVTAWALLGSFNWHSLVMRDDGSYEPGVFDLRAPTPRPTALAAMVRERAAGRSPAHPLLGALGWWRRPDRLIFPPVGSVPDSGPDTSPGAGNASTLLLAGDDPGIGEAFAAACAVRGIPHQILPRADEAAVAHPNPWAVVIADRYGQPRCRVALLAACAARSLPVLLLSSDLVFPWTDGPPAVERDAVWPLELAGRRTAATERLVLSVRPEALVVRTGPRFGTRAAGDDPELVGALRLVADEEPRSDLSRADVSPVHVPDLVHACLDLLVDGEQGIWHLAHDGAASLAELARLADGIPFPPDRTLTAPPQRLLSSERGWPLPPLSVALARYAETRAQAQARLAS